MESDNLDEVEPEVEVEETDIIRQMVKHFQNPKLKDIILVDQADVEIIKLSFMGMSIDISIGQHSGLCTLDLMNHLDKKVIGQDHLMKRSIMLLKSWMTYESSLLGS